MRALFLVSDKGNGHKVRCGALADELRRRGWDFYYAATPHNIISAHLVILDDPSVTDLMCERLVVIVDSPSQKRYADLLVCGSAGATTEMFADSVAKRVLAGPQFALLRPEFARCRDVVGTTDCEEVGCCSDGPISRHGVFDARNVVGMGPIELGVKMRTAAVVVTYGGMRSLEAACVGAPMICVERPEDGEGEILNIQALWSAGAAWWWVNYSEGKEIESLLASRLLLGSMSEAGRALVDGLGTVRVADAIEELFA